MTKANKAAAVRIFDRLIYTKREGENIVVPFHNQYSSHMLHDTEEVICYTIFIGKNNSVHATHFQTISTQYFYHFIWHLLFWVRMIMLH